MKNIPIHDVPLLVRVGTLMFQAFGALILGMMAFFLYRLITYPDETMEKLYRLLLSFEEKTDLYTHTPLYDNGKDGEDNDKHR